MKKSLTLLAIGMLASTTIPSINSVLDARLNQQLENENKITNFDKDINYRFNDWYNGVLSYYNDSCKIYTLLKWTDYAKDWDTFIKLYPNFNFDDQSIFKVSLSNGKTNTAKLFNQTQNIKVKQENNNTNSLFQIELNTFLPLPYDLNTTTSIGNYIKVNLDLWHDNDSIYFKWILHENSFCACKSYFNIELNKIFFNTNPTLDN